ncbi:hypothetical protein C1646_695416 [Rhizophagus diaphanus]|nr:hypothetical protein C1646_695416 [Rhizophagus diaphanus] [Rhizophagus sp. MUCL 43196]
MILNHFIHVYWLIDFGVVLQYHYYGKTLFLIILIKQIHIFLIFIFHHFMTITMY